MNSLARWKFRIGCYRGIQVSLSLVFILFAVVIALSLLRIENPPPTYLIFAGLMVWFFSVCIHEFAHVWVGGKFHAEIDEIILWPFGGLKPVEPEGWEYDPTQYYKDNIRITVAAIPVHLGIVVASGVSLLFAGVGLSELFQIFLPPINIPGQPVVQILGLIYWVNLGLLIVNCLPAYPLDGYRLVYSLFLGKNDPQSAAFRTSFVAKITAVGIIITAILLPDELRFATVSLLLFGIFALITEFSHAAKQAKEFGPEPEQDSFMGYDFSEGYTSLEKDNKQSTDTEVKPTKPGIIKQWMNNRKEAKDEKMRLQQANEQEQLDEILQKISDTGMESLTQEEKDFLDQMSETLREKRDSK